MRDPYLYDDVPILRNKLNIRDQILLDDAEADYVVYRLKDLALNLGDLFEWAGVPRTISIYKEEDVLGGQSVEYSDPFDIVNDVHHALSDMRNTSFPRGKYQDHHHVLLSVCRRNGFSARQKAF